ncbi:hypothetical protein [Fictibacillus sp. UD]|uniref:hypothetical protein n=1 Tax=Fictibacillus sp. UD TaxID=3038777 RepID=UPI00374A583B
MLIFSGIISLIVMCLSIVIFSSFPVSLHEKSGSKKLRTEKKDPFSYLFEVYGD